MNKTDLVDLVAHKHNLSKTTVTSILNTYHEEIITRFRCGGYLRLHPLNCVASGEAVRIAGFGNFVSSERAVARHGISCVQRTRAARSYSGITGDAKQFPAKKIPGFTPGFPFKQAVREGC